MTDFIHFENGLVLLLGTWFFELRTMLLAALIAAALACDVRHRRIPNGLVLTGLVCALVYHAALPWGLGAAYALKGAVVGLGLLLPLYLLRMLGAGDVKLMAMAGAFIGPGGSLAAVVLTLLCGGVLAVGVSLWQGRMRQVLDNTRAMAAHAAVNVVARTGIALDMPPSTGNLPYAAAIAAGVALQLWMSRLGLSLF